MTNSQRFRRWLAERIYPVDVVDLTREALGPIRSKVQFDVDSLSNADREALLTFAETVWSNPMLHKLLDSLRYAQVDHIAREARTYDEVSFCRASINGIELVEEELERLSAMFRSRRTEDKFDKYEIIS